MMLLIAAAPMKSVSCVDHPEALLFVPGLRLDRSFSGEVALKQF